MYIYKQLAMRHNGPISNEMSDDSKKHVPSSIIPENCVAF